MLITVFDRVKFKASMHHLTSRSFAGRMGDLTWPIVRDLVDDVIPVSEEEIVDAMRICFERMKVRNPSALLSISLSENAAKPNLLSILVPGQSTHLLQTSPSDISDSIVCTPQTDVCCRSYAFALRLVR